MGRKIDFYAQILLFFTIIVFLLGGIISEGYLFVGFFILLPFGLWQMISAAIHTYHALPVIKKVLSNYWKACGFSLAVFTVAFFVRDHENNTFAMILAFTGISCGVITGIYYLYIYKKYLLNGKHEKEDSVAGSIG